jgi:acyl-coenzyme A synthetase/AMP-(fatty) acid ligase
MSPDARRLTAPYIRLSGEIADQAILDALHTVYPDSTIAQAFASSEAGVAFDVSDGLAGFPETLLGKRGEVEMKVDNDSLQIRSNRTAQRYIGSENGPLKDDAGFVDTGDVVELRHNRYYFLGRRNGVINVGGYKVYPEEIESVINRHPAVRMSRVEARRNPITGSVVIAEVVVKEMFNGGIAADGAEDFRNEIQEICRQSLPPHKVPAVIRCVTTLRVAQAGKMVRGHA